MKLRMFVILCLTPPSGILLANTPQFISAYTSLTRCQVLERPGKTGPGGPNDHYLARCPGREGYAVYHEGGDVRSWLILKKGRQIVDLQGIAEQDLFFPVLAGIQLEWRYREKKLTALIFRMNGNVRTSYDRGDDSKTESFLYAVRLTSENYCILGKAKTNEEARQLADGDQKPQYCRRYER